MAQPLQANSSMTSIDTKVIEVELNELRHHLEQEVKKRTEQLTRCITLLESCNASLCDKLELARTELAALRQQLAVQVIQLDPVTQTNDCDCSQTILASKREAYLGMPNGNRIRRYC